MDLRLLREGRSFTLYDLNMGGGAAEFIRRLGKDDPAEHARMMRRLEQLADRGPSRRRSEFNDLGGELYEAKSKGGGRIVFFYDAGRIVICACGFTKQSKKTPKAVLKTARIRKRAYEECKASGRGFNIFVPEGMEEPRRMP